jgi:hypothetical protein
MGSANITPLQGIEIVKVMKKEYDSIQNQEMSQEELKEKLLFKYENAVAKAKLNQPTQPLSTLIKKIQRGGNGTKSMEARPRSVTRFRSFDEAPTPKKKERVGGIVESPHEETTDSWDSVKAQPACLLCAMVFTSPDKLATHTKYSVCFLSLFLSYLIPLSLSPSHPLLYSSSSPALLSPQTIHASNLKRLEEAKFAASKITSPPKPIVRAPPVRHDQLAVPYRVIYTGSKFFWRSKHNIDFHIYHHTEPAPISILEIIGYDSATNTELPRLYLNEEIVSATLSSDEILSRVKLHKDSNTKYLSVLESMATSAAPHQPNHLFGVKTMKPKLLKIADEEPTVTPGDQEGMGAVSEVDDEGTSASLNEQRGEGRIERKHSTTEQELEALMYEEEKRLSLASRIMSKLQYQKVVNLSPIPSARNVTIPSRNSNRGATSPRLVQYDLCFIDTQLQSAVLTEKPLNLSPVIIPRRRHSTQAEINESFRSLNTMQMELHEMTNKAEKMSHLIRQSIEMFTQHHFVNSSSSSSSSKQSQYLSPRKKSQLPVDKQSLAERKKEEIRERWRYTIHKVVLRNALGHTIEFLQNNSREQDKAVAR